MKTRMRLMLAVLRKDLRLFWLFAVLAAVLLAAWRFPPVVPQMGMATELAWIVILLATALLVLVVLHEDPVVSVNHDWLTRPIPGLTLLAAKALFLVLAILVPSILGAVGWNLYQGHSLGESLLAGLFSGASGGTLLAIMATMALAAITTGIRQAIAVLLLGVAAFLVAARLVWAPNVDEPSPTITGSGWVITDGRLLLLALGAVLVLWLQYRHRRTWVARGIAVAALLAAIVVVRAMSWPGVFAIQKSLSRDPTAAALVNVGMADGCFPVREMDGAGKARNGGAFIKPSYYDDARLRRAGPGALGFSTILIERSVPDGHQLVVDHIDLTYRVGSRVVARADLGRRPWQRTMNGDAVLADSGWLLRKDDQQRLTAMAGVESHFVYSLSLLKPVASATITAGAARSYLPGIGYCSATAWPGIVKVDCFKPGIQPAELVAFLEGTPERFADTSSMDFTPAALELWGGKRYQMSLYLGPAQAPRVHLTAYEARAHFDRVIDVPGVLGGPLSRCPIFPTPPEGSQAVR